MAHAHTQTLVLITQIRYLVDALALGARSLAVTTMRVATKFLHVEEASAYIRSIQRSAINLMAPVNLCLTTTPSINAMDMGEHGKVAKD
jgi:hypothetical protein